MPLSMRIFLSVLPILGYIVAPASLTWGWMRWAKLPKGTTVPAILSLIGFILASASGLLGLAAILFAQEGGAEVQGNVVRWFLLPGVAVSLTGFLFAIGGIWRKNSLRWFAPAGAIATLAFWLLVAGFID
jgi:hypothetical protein